MNKIEFDTQICTTIEQSKRLLELGLKPETADCYYSYEVEEHGENRFWEIIVSDWEPYWEITNNTIPAWSLHRLFAMVCNYPCKDHFIFDFSMDYDSMEDVYDSVIEVIESHIKENNFNKEYLKEE